MTSVTSMDSSDRGADRRQGDTYRLTPEEIASFRRDGYVHLKGVMSPAEMDAIEEVYERFLRGEIHVVEIGRAHV